jgi:hypothetical protein
MDDRGLVVVGFVDVGGGEDDVEVGLVLVEVGEAEVEVEVADVEVGMEDDVDVEVSESGVEVVVSEVVVEVVVSGVVTGVELVVGLVVVGEVVGSGVGLVEVSAAVVVLCKQYTFVSAHPSLTKIGIPSSCGITRNGDRRGRE